MAAQYEADVHLDGPDEDVEMEDALIPSDSDAEDDFGQNSDSASSSYETDKDTEVLGFAPPRAEAMAPPQVPPPPPPKELRVPPPDVGMVFACYDDLDRYYYAYAKENGFTVTCRGREKRRTNSTEKDYVRFHCSKGGVYKSRGKNPNRVKRSRKTNCKVAINAWLERGGAWRITTAHNVHNHDADPADARHMPNNRNLSAGDERKLRSLAKAGIPISKSYLAVAADYEGVNLCPFTERDARNRMNRIRRLKMEGGDFAAFQRYQDRMALESPNFFRAVQYDDEGRVVNIFWCDGRAREAYKDFGDVVSFDATYMKNKYKMPLCPFIGVNHHGQSIILGCALIASESTRNFVWLFRQFLTCMEGKAPMGIITDQCKGMEKAIKLVLPNTSHRRCLFHIMQNAERHMKRKHKLKWKEIEARMKNVMHSCVNVKQFEDKWKEMLVEFELEDNEWLKSLMLIKHQWAPVYFKHSFWAGMSSTQRSEGMNNFFKTFFHPTTSLREFAEQFNGALAKRVEAEAKETHRMNDAPIECRFDYAIEPIFAKVYTRLKLKEFQEELSHVGYQVDYFDEEIEGQRFYRVQDKSKYCKWADPQNGMFFRARFRRSTCEIKCECRKFEFTGILCRHIVKIFEREGIMEVPEKYILERWRMDVPRNYLKYNIPDFTPGAIGPEPARYARLRGVFEDTASSVMGKPELAKELEDFMKQLRLKARGLAELFEGLELVESGTGAGRVFRRQRTVCNVPMPENPIPVVPLDPSQPKLIDPIVRVGPGRPRKNRVGYKPPTKAEKKAEKKKENAQKRKSAIYDGLTPSAEVLEKYPSQAGSDYNADVEPSQTQTEGTQTWWHKKWQF